MARRERKTKEETAQIKGRVASVFKQSDPLKKMASEELEVLLLEITGELEKRQATGRALPGMVGSTRSLRRFYAGIYEE